MPRILVIGPAWVGDMVMAQSLFQLLKQQTPLTDIDVLAPDWSKPLLTRMPEVNQALSLPFMHGEVSLRLRRQLATQLKTKQYDQAIVLPNSWKSALIPYFAKIPLRTGWRGELRWGLLNDIRILNKQLLPTMVQRFMALGLPSQAEAPPILQKPALIISTEHRQRVLEKYQLNTNQPILALCPGAEFGPSKRWPAEYFAEVALGQYRKNWQIWLFGSPNDREAAQIIQQATDHKCIDLIGKTDLAEAIDLLSLPNLVISNDTGLMHIAAALQRRLIVLYGSTDPAFTPPLSETAKILSISLACRPCFQRTCPLQHHRCMNDLLPEQVIQAIQHANIID